ncbi:HNH endonuclease [Alicyclobacillus sp. ALC3]|uniref:HNH endonuclease n=1 Tax=Alicyclobacillus sp. ALC3 TaxID=2796143 RepID=UPI0023797937|nr:HNH endonuclease [Alicyclobacillus sp. ALC3]WDL96938.1 HNH endonuclease [Alicyclobacillus sp. ALC3]
MGRIKPHIGNTIVHCDNCGREIRKFPSQVKEHNYCSRACAQKVNFSNLRDGANRPVEKTCLVCGRPFAVKAVRSETAKYCGTKCYAEAKRELFKMENNPQWNGGVVIDVHGYRLRKVGPDYPGANSKGYIRNARYVWQETTGDVLKAGEEIHHINEDRLDDRIENLQKFASHAEHVRIGHNGRPTRRS